MKPTFNFPYFGAGKASYLEWAVVTVIFKEEPNKEQKKKIEKNVPFPIAQISWEENIMTARSDRYVHFEIAETYQTKDGLDPNDKKNWENDGWFYYAADSQVDAFNKDIEKWFNEINGILPILLTFRANDFEVEETEFSDWHRWSLKQFNTVLPYFEGIITNFHYDNYGKDSKKKETLSGILYMIDIGDILKLENKYLKHLYPGELEFEAFEKGNIEALKNISNSNYAERTIRVFIKNWNENHQKEITKYADIFLGFESKISSGMFKELNKKIFTYYTDIYSETFKTIADKITSQHFIDKLAGNAYKLMADRKLKESLLLSERILLCAIEPNISSGFYTNILWLLQKDNTGFPINKKSNKLALEKCIPKAAEYPAIFFNACCVYTEMEEYDKAYKMVEEAIAHHYDKKNMINEIETEDMYKEFRAKTNVLDLLKNYELEPIENPKPRFISPSDSYGRFNTHTIYGRGYRLYDFSHFVLINGHVNIKGEFNDTYKTLIEGKRIVEKNILVIVNGNLLAKSISENKDVYILVMGKIKCKNITHKEIIEKGKTNFDFVPLKPKKYNE